MLILASGSPRRREIMERMGLQFIVDSANVEEQASSHPVEMVERLAAYKAEAVAQRYTQAWVLAADTVVYCDTVLGKPQSPQEAADMLHKLSGRWHEVYTGLCLIDVARRERLVTAECTRVHFETMDETFITRYVQSGEPMDKAGAYGIQGCAEMWIDRIEGCYSNVMGLPAARLRGMLQEFAEKIR